MDSMQSLPSTDAIRRQMKAAHGERLKELERVLALCLERDAIQATRPEGCWCLGVGYGKAEGFGVSAFTRFCSCPEGREARLAQEIADAGVPVQFRGFTLASSPVVMRSPGLEKKLRPGSWYLWGPSGVGKTGLAVGLLREWCSQGKGKGLFVTVPGLLESLRGTYGEGAAESEERVIARYGRVPFLVMDDLGAEHVKGTGWVEDRLYQIIGMRHDDGLPTVFTSNMELGQLRERLGERVVWRIVELVGKNIVHVVGPNLRR